MDAGLGAKQLHEALTRFQAGDHRTATTAALAALEAFTGASDRTGAAAAHQLLGILSMSQGNYDNALTHIDMAIPLRESTGDREGIAALLQERFELCLRVGKLDEARQAMERQIQVHELSGDKEGRAHAMHQLAQLHLQNGNDALAEALIQEAIFAMDGPGNERARSALQLLYANIWLTRNEPRRALAHAEQGLNLARQSRFRPAEIDAQQQLGVVLAAMGDHPTARRVLEDALVGRDLMKDAEGRFQVLRELAAVELGMGEVDAGLDRLESAARGARDSGHHVGEITALQLLQVSADEHQKADRALKAARELVVATTGFGDREAMAAANFALATRLATLGELKEAEAGFQEALGLQRALGLHHEAAVATGMIGQIQVARGQKESGVRLLRSSLMELESLGSEAAETVREVLSEVEG